MGGDSTEDISAGIEAESARLVLFVDNPFDVRGNTFAFGKSLQRAPRSDAAAASNNRLEGLMALLTLAG